MVAVYLGEPDEEKILSMSYIFFQSILKQLNRRLKYDAAVGYAGNSFFKKSNELINENNPLLKDAGDNVASYGEQLANMFKMGKIQIEERKGEDKFAEKFGLKFGEDD